VWAKICFQLKQVPEGIDVLWYMMKKPGFASKKNAKPDELLLAK
jgi:hypothetical protein